MGTSKILRLLQSNVIPWTMDDCANRLILAQAKMDQSQMPFGVEVKPNPIKGKRIIRKNKRIFANQRLHVADWPDDNLHELAVPKLACIVEGEVSYLIERYKICATAGHFIIIPPYTRHQRSGPFFHDTGSSHLPYTILQANGYRQGVVCWISSVRQGQPSHSNNGHYLITNDVCANLMQTLANEAKEEREGCRIICAQMLSTLFLLLNREIAEGHFTHPGPKSMDESPQLAKGDFIDQLRSYLETNCHKPLNQDSVAEHFYMSRSQFTRRIRKATGTTFNDMLVSIRLERAKVMLLETDWTFNAICGYLSFKSSSYFLELFRKRVGCTPGEYRKRHK